MKLLRTFVSAIGLAFAVSAGAQISALVVNPAGPNGVFPKQNVNGPTSFAQQVNYPYEGQCVADPLNQKYFPDLKLCTLASAPSFACPSGRTAGGWAICGADAAGNVLDRFRELAPNGPPLAANRFLFDVLNPPAYTQVGS